MKNQVIEIAKDIFISLLIVLLVTVIISIFFYEDIALGKVIPEAEDYMLSDEMQKELEDSELEDAQEVIVNYYIDAADLKKYEKTNEYDKGKSNPFAVADISDGDNNITNEGNNSSSTNNDTNNSGSGNFYDDEGIK